MARVFCENPNDFPVGFQTRNEKKTEKYAVRMARVFCENPNGFPVEFQTENKSNEKSTQ